MFDTTFNTNWNGKLNCNCFTSIRIANPKKYAVNSDHKIFLKDNFLYNARVLAYKELYLCDLNDFMAFLDTGFSRLETREFLYKLYPNIDFHTQKICFILFGRNPIQTKAINNTPIFKGFLNDV